MRTTYVFAQRLPFRVVRRLLCRLSRALRASSHGRHRRSWRWWLGCKSCRRMESSNIRIAEQKPRSCNRSIRRVCLRIPDATDSLPHSSSRAASSARFISEIGWISRDIQVVVLRQHACCNSSVPGGTRRSRRYRGRLVAQISDRAREPRYRSHLGPLSSNSHPTSTPEPSQCRYILEKFI